MPYINTINQTNTKRLHRQMTKFIKLILNINKFTPSTEVYNTNKLLDFQNILSYYEFVFIKNFILNKTFKNTDDTLNKLITKNINTRTHQLINIPTFCPNFLHNCINTYNKYICTHS